MPSARVPGVVVHHLPASTRRYLSCPCIVVVGSGDYLVSLGYLGAGASNTDTYLFRSRDGGASWQPVAEIKGQIWSTLFPHRGALYLLGTDHADAWGGRLNGRIVIRRSADGGVTWTEPRDTGSGLLAAEDGYHTGAVPVLFHNGRVWRGMEFSPEKERATWRPFVMSTSAEDDLLCRDSWTFSNQFDHPWSSSQWIEGNAVAAPDGSVFDILRTNYRGPDPALAEAHMDRACLLRVSADGRSLTHDRARDIIDFPGGGTKFTIRRDPSSGLYWALVNKQRQPQSNRNALYLSRSADLRAWHVADRLLYHTDEGHHAFQYVDWDFDGDDLVYVSRTAYDDGLGGARNYHDANFVTFHRVAAFRRLTTRVWQGEPGAG